MIPISIEQFKAISSDPLNTRFHISGTSRMNGVWQKFEALAKGAELRERRFTFEGGKPFLEDPTRRELEAHYRSEGNSRTAAAKLAEAYLQKNDKDGEDMTPEQMAKLNRIDSISARLDEVSEIKAQLEAGMQKMQRLSLGGGSGPIPGEKSEHMQAVARYIVRGDEAGLRAYQASINIASDPAGGYAVPEELDKNVNRLLADASPMRSVSTVVPVTTSDYRKLVTITRATATHVTESSARPETTAPTLASLSPAWSEIYAAPMVSQYALDDAAFNVEEWLQNEVVQTFAETENEDFTNGSGAPGYAKGILQYTTAATADSARAFGTLEHIVSGDASAFIAPTAVAGPGDCLLSLIYATKAAHRRSGIFMMNKKTLGVVRGFRDYVTGNYLWQPGVAAGQPSVLLGYPVIENEAFPDIAGNAFPIAFGNFKTYQIVDRLGMRMLRDPFTSKPNTTIYIYKRFGNLLLDSEGIKLLKIAAA